jgi:hypothetical protein
MATDLSQEILKYLQQLSPDEQLAILDQIRKRSANSSAAATRSILELEGLGTHVWEGVDAQDYVRRERESWNG